MLFAQALPQRRKQGVVGRAAEVVDLHPMWLALAARRTDSHERQAPISRPGRQRGLGAHLIAAVDQTVEIGAADQGGPVVGFDELLDDPHRTAGVDVGDALAQRLGLGHADRRPQGLDLTVDIGFGNLIEVDQRQLGRATASQRFDCPRADATQTHDREARGTQPLIGRIAVQAAQASEAPLQISLELIRGHHFSAASRSLPA